MQNPAIAICTTKHTLVSLLYTESTFIASAIQSKTHLYLIVHAIYMYELLRRVHLLFARVHQMQNVNHYKTICNGLVCFRVKLFRIPL